ncbi:MAG TPA: NAD(P)-dependent oxidoreductase [Stellaceae bacterium]|nr:NAD(P)-dependent oxidoreductase [Stellaceae bacterium]
MKVLVEADAVLRSVPVVLDPDTKEEHRRAVADWYSFDEPDFAGWLARLRQQLPGLYPAKVEFARDAVELGTKIADADALIVESLEVGEAALAGARRLKIVQKFGGLAHNIDVAACLKHGVAVDVQRRRVNVAVAEQAMALMLALARRICALQGVVTEAALRQAGFDITPFDRRYTGNSNFARIRGFKTLARSTLGLVGMGEIGREIAARAAAFGMTVLYHQRRRLNPLDEGALKARYVGLDALMAEADFISPVLPMNDSTRGIIGRAQLARVKPGAMLVNVARAELVDHDALVAALESGRLAGFALDVGYQEPWPQDERLLAFKAGNVILMPHTAVAERQNNLDDLAEMCLKVWRGVTRPEMKP